ncbi:replication initiation protein [Vibrio sinaloensis]|uniref:Initiator Rep protein WH1 domain-containing protein n=1 Tax=Photobacterium sp. (strain ATCC 43367) TaxID=379097 RepID=A0A0A5HNC7_PHOS4|nr:replication initiation protein [Vibrio sinaloensis]KGY07042.1 hypothetical protein NM06_19145 [Vibrio sinaloensis]
MNKVPVIEKINDESNHVVRYVSIDISMCKVYYANELAFAEHAYSLKEAKLLDIVSSQLSLHPLYDGKVMSLDNNGKSSIDFDYLTKRVLIKCYIYKEFRTIYLSNRVICDYLGLNRKISRIPNLDEFQKKKVTIREKSFPSNKKTSNERTTKKTLNPFKKIKTHQGYVEFVLNPAFIPYIIGVHGFKQYDVELSLKLKHKFSLRLLKIINYYHHHGGFGKTRNSKVFDIIEFMVLLGDIPASYRDKPNLLFSKAVNPALEEIAKVAGIHYKAEIFTFPLGRKGRPQISGVKLVPVDQEIQLDTLQMT